MVAHRRFLLTLLLLGALVACVSATNMSEYGGIAWQKALGGLQGSSAPVLDPGGIAWQKSLGGAEDDHAYSIQQTADGGYIVTGHTYSNDGDVSGNHGNTDYWVVKVTAAGTFDWQKCLGGLSFDEARSIQQTADGGYIVAGYTYSNDGNVTGNHGNQDYWVVKLDSAGTILWQRCLGGSQDDSANYLQQTADGGYIVAGKTYSNNGDVSGNHGDQDYWIVKLDPAGTILWQRCLGGSGTDAATSIQQITDGGYIVAGYSNSNDGNVAGNHGNQDYWIVKLDHAGTILWQKCLGGSGGDEAQSIRQTADDGYIVAGFSLSNDGTVSGNHGGMDYWVVKITATGTVNWQGCYGGSSDDYAYGIRQTADGGYIVAGHTNSNNGDVTGNHGNYDYWVVRLNSAGTIFWQQCLGGTSTDSAYSVQQTADGGYIVTGYTYSNNGNVTGNHGKYDYWVVKLNPDTAAPGSTVPGQDYAKNIRQTSDGGYIVAGYTYSNDSNVTGNHGSYDYWVVKLDSAGTTDWQRCLGGSNSDQAYSIQQTADSGYIVAGYTTSNDGNVNGNHGSYDYWVVKLDRAGTTDWQRCLGGSNVDYANSIQQTTDGGYILAGSTRSNDGDVNSNHGFMDYWVIKLGSTGTLLWQRCLGGSSYDTAYDIQQTVDGGYIVAGYTYSNDGNVAGNHGNQDYWVVKLDSAGTILWQKCLGGSGTDVATSIRQTADGGYIVAGYTWSNDGNVNGNHGSADYWVVKLGSTGTILWQKCLGGLQGEVANSIQQTADGGYIVVGYTTSNDGNVSGNHGNQDYWVVRLDSTGTLLWQRCLGGSSADEAYSLQQIADGGYIIAGNTESNDGNVTGNHGYNDYWVVTLMPDITPAPLPPGIELATGWNFISTPRTLSPGLSNGSMVFGAVETDGHTIWLYNASGAVWEYVTANTPIKPLDGIWIYSTSPTHVNLTYSTDPVGSLPRKQLYAGWNAIGFAGKSKASAWATLSSISTKWIRAMGYNSTAREFDNPMVNGESSGQYSMYRDMVPTKGYWLYVTTDTPLEAFSV